MVVVAYAAFILLLALPLLVPFIFVLSLVKAALAVAKGLIAAAAIWTVAAGLLGALMFGPPGYVPLAREYQQVRDMQRGWAVGLRMMGSFARHGSFGLRVRDLPTSSPTDGTRRKHGYGDDRDESDHDAGRSNGG